MECRRYLLMIGLLFTLSILASSVIAQAEGEEIKASMYDIPPRWLVDMPTAGTLPRGNFDIGVRFYPNGGSLGFTNIGISNRLTLGISYGAEDIISSRDPDFNPSVEFNFKFRVIDEMEYFPALTVGFCSQGYGAYDDNYSRYTYKSRGFFGVVSRSFYFYQWTAGWHLGMNYSREYVFDKEKDINFFAGFDATFNYNLALVGEYDAALNDDRAELPDGVTNPEGLTGNEMGGKGRGYFNLGIKWLYNENLELEAVLKDLFVNRRESETVTREIRITYIGSF